MARSRIEQCKQVLVGKDPLSIERHFLNMMSFMHPYMAHIPTISGIDIALWDLAGKITGQPVNVLLGGPFRDAIKLYSHGGGLKPLDTASCKEWAARVKAAPEGFTAFKVDIHGIIGVPMGRFAPTLDTSSDSQRSPGVCEYPRGRGRFHRHRRPLPQRVRHHEFCSDRESGGADESAVPRRSDAGAAFRRLGGAQAVDADPDARRREAGTCHWVQAVP